MKMVVGRFGAGALLVVLAACQATNPQTAPPLSTGGVQFEWFTPAEQMQQCEQYASESYCEGTRWGDIHGD